MRLPGTIRLAVSALKLAGRPDMAGLVHVDFVEDRWFAHAQRVHGCSLSQWKHLIKICSRCRQFHSEEQKAT